MKPRIRIKQLPTGVLGLDEHGLHFIKPNQDFIPFFAIASKSLFDAIKSESDFTKAQRTFEEFMFNNW